MIKSFYKSTKLLSKLGLLILVVILSGCGTRSCNPSYKGQDLPEMPLAGEKVAAELERICDDTKCASLNEWLNELYLFRQQYIIYQAK